jgi:hypothetical protein
VAGSCEHGDEPSGSTECGEFPDYLSVLLASQEGLCSMELVIEVALKCYNLNETVSQTVILIFYDAEWK